MISKASVYWKPLMVTSTFLEDFWNASVMGVCNPGYYFLFFRLALELLGYEVKIDVACLDTTVSFFLRTIPKSCGLFVCATTDSSDLYVLFV